MKKICILLAAAVSVGTIGILPAHAADTVTAPVSISETDGRQETMFIITYHEIDGVEVPATYGVEPRMKYINDISAWIGRSGYMATCTGSMTTNREYEKTLSVSIEKNEQDWKRLKTWSTTDNENSMVVVERKYALTKGNSYHAVTTASVTTPEGGSEIVSGYSATIYY